MVNVIARSRTDREDILGKFAEPSDFDLLIDEDTDLYNVTELSPDQKDEGNIIFKFRKGVFTKEEQDLAYEGLRDAATESQNRGMAAGPRGDMLTSSQRGGREWVSEWQDEVIDFFANAAITDESLFPVKRDNTSDTRGRVWLRSKVLADEQKYGEYFGWFDRWVEKVKTLPREEQRKEALTVAKMVSETNYAATVRSGIAGYYDRYPRIPYGRLCGFNEREPEKFEKSFPYLRKLNDVFRRELPSRWGAQRACADKLDPRFVIDETVFTTLTVNYNWRTAGHRDAGDLTSGFSNISGIGKGWKGCYFTLPEWKVGINLQPGDLLLVNNHEGIHTNTSFENEEEADRISIVAYFRENMLNLKSFDYEMLRKKFVEERRANKSHKYYRHLWNGVSPGMWEEKEWADYLSLHNMVDEDKDTVSSLDRFF